MLILVWRYGISLLYKIPNKIIFSSGKRFSFSIIYVVSALFDRKSRLKLLKIVEEQGRFSSENSPKPVDYGIKKLNFPAKRCCNHVDCGKKKPDFPVKTGRSHVDYGKKKPDFPVKIGRSHVDYGKKSRIFQ